MRRVYVAYIRQLTTPAHQITSPAPILCPNREGDPDANRVLDMNVNGNGNLDIHKHRMWS